jgi:transcriptional regulator with XRE-family HTH domain
MTRQEILEKLNSIAKPSTSWLEDASLRVENQDWLVLSQRIALNILRSLRTQNKKQTDLAEALNVSPQQVNKWVKGKENFKLETIVKINAALGTDILSTKIEQTTAVNVVQRFDRTAERVHRSNRSYSKLIKTSSKCKIVSISDYSIPTKLAR